MRKYRAASALLAVTLAPSRALTQSQPTKEWPHWRGAAFDGTGTTSGNLLAKPFDLHVRWKRSLGAGYSGIAVADGHAVTLFSDGTRDFLVAVNADTGRDEWRVPLGAAFPGRDGPTHSMWCATPAGAVPWNASPIARASRCVTSGAS